jgi:diaminohydroxyphosphoribosylaminopyrimidine deaminase/5-amino-6-(5-phosphoribosylamino)uracil reductase
LLPHDAALMRLALACAAPAIDRVRPNPAVGAVLSRDGTILSTGTTQPPGGPHAEVMALRGCADARGATLHVTLEPCNHTGRTGPCTEAAIAAGIARVAIAARDPHALASGGIARLRAAGIEVTHGILAREAVLQNPWFHIFHREGRPLVTLKWAQTLDGATGTESGDSRWISSPEARAAAHGLRARHDAVLVGVGTLLADDARLTVRDAELLAGPPRRIVLDSRLRTPPDAALFKDLAGGVAIACAEDADPARESALRARGAEVWRLPVEAGRVSLRALLRRMAEERLMSVLVEGGRTVAGAFLAADLADRIEAFVAPRIIGAGAAGVGPLQLAQAPSLIAQARPLLGLRVEQAGPDLRWSAWLREPCGAQ